MKIDISKHITPILLTIITIISICFDASMVGLLLWGGYGIYKLWDK